MVMLEYTTAEKDRFDELAALYLTCRSVFREITIETGQVAVAGSPADQDEKELLARDRPVPGEVKHLISFTAQTYLQAASEHMGALAALYIQGEVLISPVVLARTAIEHSSHAAWIVGSSADSAVDRLARAYLEEIKSAEQAQLHALGVFGRESDTFKLRREHFRQVKKEAKGLFDEPHQNDDGIPIYQGQMLPGPEGFVVWMNEAGTRPLTGAQTTGTYAYLSSHVHPTAHIIRELFDVREENGVIVPRLTRGIVDHEQLAGMVVVFFYNALTYISSYHRWVSASHQKMTDAIDAFLPGVFGANPQPGPFDSK